MQQMTEKKKTILLVEDEVLIAMDEARMLEGHGYAVITANSGEEAVAAAKSNPAVELVLMDIDLGPGMDGTQAAEIILSELDVPVVFLSSHTEPEVVAKTEGITSYGYVVKNSGETVLLASIKMAFRLYEARLRILRQEERYGLLLEAIPDSVYVLDREWRHTLVNDAAEKFTGKAREELLGHRLMDAFPGVENTPFFESFRRVMEDRKPVAVRGEYRFADDRIGYYEVSIAPVPEGILCISRDLTDFKRAEKELLGNNEKFLKLFRSNPVGMMIVALYSYTIIDVNDSMEMISGYSREEFIGHNSIAMGLWADQGERDHVVEILLEKGRVRDFEARFRLKSGEVRWGNYAADLLELDGEQCFLLTVVDVTARRRMEDALRISEARYQKAQEVGHTGSWEYNLETEQFWGSDEARRIYGFDAGKPDFSTEEVESRIPERERVHQALVDLIQSGKEYDLEFEIHPGNSPVPRIISSVAEVRRDVNGRPLVVTGVIQDITGRKRVESALKESEERYRALFESDLDCVYVHDLEGNFLDANDATLRLLGYGRDEIRSLNFAALIGGDQLGKAMMTLEELIANGKQARPMEYRLTGKNGKVVTVETIGNLMCRDGAPREVIGIARDITEQKRGEEALHVALVKHKVLFDSFPLGITVTDEGGGVLECNFTAEKLLGLSRERHVQRGIAGPEWHIIRPDGTPMPSGEFASVRALKEKRPVENVEMGIVKPGGEITWINVTAAPLALEGHGVVITYGDITARRRAEKALLRSEGMFRALVENINLGIFTTTLEGRFLQANPAVARIGGYDSVEEFMGVPALKLYADPADRDRMVRLLRKTGFVKGMEMRSVKKNGAVYWISMSAVLMKEGDGTPRGITGFVDDITERKRTERLIEAERDLGLALSGAMSIDDVPRCGLAAALAVTEMECGGVYLVDDEGGLDLIVHEGLSGNFTRMVARYGADTPNARMVLRGVPGYVDESGVTGGLEVNSMDGDVMSIVRNEGLLSIATVPVCLMGRALACMNVSSRSRGTIPRHARMALESVASRMGSAILRIRAQDELARAAQEKQTLHRELQHRIKNTLTIITSLVGIEAGSSQDAAVRSALEKIRGRIGALASLYAQLYESQGSGEVRLDRYLGSIAESICSAYGQCGGEIEFIMELEEALMDVKRASSMGLILNELLTNAYKYAFDGLDGGAVLVGLASNNGSLRLSVTDTGRGLPEGLDLANPKGFGLKLARMMAKQLGGDFEFELGGVTTFRVKVPLT
jgi:PAS domain S-box-containing protein